MSSVELERVETTCNYCNKPVVSIWTKGGVCLSSNAYTLIADWVVHTECLDKSLEQYEMEKRIERVLKNGRAS